MIQVIAAIASGAVILLAVSVIVLTLLQGLGLLRGDDNDE